MKTFLAAETCPVRNIVSLFGDKWSLLVISSLAANGTMRFSELQKSIGDVSQRMLTVTLKQLQQLHLVNRVAFNEIPPRVEYSLTSLGQSLVPRIDALIEWAIEHREECL